MGCAVARPETIAQLHDDLARSAARDVPTVIEIKAQSALAQALAV